MSENTNNHREAIAGRIRALLSKTVENGCTEAEALAAAAKARAIMDAHRLTQSDVEIEAEPIETDYIDRDTDHKLTAADMILYGLDKYCGVETWFWKSRRNGVYKRRLCIFGLKSDVEMARYIYEMVATTIGLETKRYTANPANRGYDAADTRRINQSFGVGMARRINERLAEMAAAANATAHTSSGTALVVVKNAVVAEAYKALDLKLTHRLSGPRARDHGAYEAGKAAGNRVNLGRPVGSNGAAIRIG